MAKSINAKFTADFSQFEKAIDEVTEVHIKTFEKGIKEAGRMVQRFTEEFSGAKIQREAAIIAKGIEAVGGASKLTDSEARKLNATITEAIAKYRALGQEVPASIANVKRELDGLAAASKNLAPANDAAGLSVGKLTASYVAGMATWEGAKRILGGVVSFLDSSIDSYAAAEKSSARLTQALRNQGRATDETVGDLSALASEFQRTTRFSDDLVTEVEALFVQLGDVGPKDMKVAIQAAADLSEGLGIDLEQAATAVSKALQGNDTALRKMAPSLDEAAVKGGNLAEIAGEIEKRFGGQASAALDTYAGRVEQVANQWDNVKEAVGAAIVNDEILRALMRRLTDELVDATDETQTLTVTQLAMGNAWAQGNPPLAIALGLLDKYAASANAAAEAQTFLNRTIEALSKKPQTVSLKGMFPEITSAGLAEFEKQNTLIDEGREAAKRAEAAYQEWAKTVTGLGRAMAAADLEARLSRLTREGKLNEDAIESIVKEYEAMRPALDALPPRLEAFRVAHQQALDGVRGSLEKLSDQFDKIEEKAQLGLDHEALVEYDQALDQLARRFDTVGDFATASSQQLKNAFPRGLAMQLMNPFGQALTDVTEHTEDWGSTLRDVARVLDDLGQSLGASGAWLSDIAQVTDGFGDLLGAVKAVKAAEASGDRSAQFSAWAAGIGSILGLYNALSSVIDEINQQQQVTRTQAELEGLTGLDLSREDAAALVNQGIRTYTQALSQLDALIQQQGGVTIYNAAQFTKLLGEALMPHPQGNRRLGLMGLEEMSRQIETVFPHLAQVVVESGSLASKSLLGIIDRVRELGIESVAVTDFIASQANKALGGLGQFVDTRGGIFDQLSEAEQRLADLERDALIDSKDIDPKDIVAATAEVERLQKQLAAIPLTAAGAGAVGASLFAIFEELTRGGQPALEVLRQIDPLIGSLDRQLAATGLSGGAAFDSLKGLADLATDETFGPALTAISGLGSALEGLHNAGLLNEEIFDGLADQISTTFNELIDQGVDGEQALRLIAPTLQDLWELQDDFGYSVDESTQKLVDEAEAAGLVGEAHRTEAEKML